MATIIITTDCPIDIENVAGRYACAGAQVFITPPLYHLPEGSPLWSSLPLHSPEVIFISPLYARAAESLLRKHGFSGNITALRSPLEVEYPPPVAGQPGSVTRLSEECGERWYPVIDQSRCANCGHCRQFCLFGVYSEENEEVYVANPDRCKAGCPACSRICPLGAIIFPLFWQDSAIAGAPGEYPSPDAKSRQMYFERTGKQLPAGDSANHVEIDALIDQLDELTKG